MQEILIFATVLAPIILGLVEMCKQTIRFPTNYVPLVSVIIGLAVGFAAQPFTDLDLSLRLWAGVISGLSATGLFEAFTNSDGYTKTKGSDK